jgi:hypothetical protein
LPAVVLLQKAAHAVALPPSPEPVFIADYGSSEGRNSIPPIAAAIGELRGRIGRERAIFVFHTDLPDNDFTALFHTLAFWATHVRSSSWTNWKPVLLHGSRQHRFE